jgi:Domain of unknown function (DUF4382)
MFGFGLSAEGRWPQRCRLNGVTFQIVKTARLQLVALALALAFALPACGSASADLELATLSVNLSEGPGPYERIDIVLESLDVHRKTDDEETWVRLDATPSRLVSIQTDSEQRLSQASIRPGAYDRFRLRVQSVAATQAGRTVPVTLESSEKIVRYPFEVRPGDNVDVLLDIDVFGSLHVAPDGSLSFSPALNVKRESRAP